MHAERSSTSKPPTSLVCAPILESFQYNCGVSDVSVLCDCFVCEPLRSYRAKGAWWCDFCFSFVNLILNWVHLIISLFNQVVFAYCLDVLLFSGRKYSSGSRACGLKVLIAGAWFLVSFVSKFFSVYILFPRVNLATWDVTITSPRASRYSPVASR